MTDGSTSEKETVDVANHPDQIYYLSFETNELIPEYSMLKIVKRKKESND